MAKRNGPRDLTEQEFCRKLRKHGFRAIMLFAWGGGMFEHVYPSAVGKDRVTVFESGNTNRYMLSFLLQEKQRLGGYQ